MHLLVNLVIAFLSVGFTEIIAKPLFRHFFQRQFRTVAPIILQELDHHLIPLLQTGGRKALEGFIRHELEATTGKPARSADVEELFRLFDPRVAADVIGAQDRP